MALGWCNGAGDGGGADFGRTGTKWIERTQERERRKSWVFHQLMATRRARLSPDHVQALNMIDLAFYGRRDAGTHRPTRTEIAVTDAWHVYLDHLSTKSEDGNT